MSQPYNDAELSGGDHVDPDNPLRNHYSRTWTVVEDSPVAGMKSLSVSVNFPTASADSVRTLRTYITK